MEFRTSARARRRTPRPATETQPQRVGLSRRRSALLLIALLLPAAQTARAVEIYYARAIGQEYLPEERPPAGMPESGQPRSSGLPALGDGGREPAVPEMSVWSKLLIGVALVAAVAALGNGDGGSAQVGITPGDAPDAGGSGVPPGRAPGGESNPRPREPDRGIDIDIDDDLDFGLGDDRDADDDRGRARDRGRGRGRD